MAKWFYTPECPMTEFGRYCVSPVKLSDLP